ncbi:hypothetical protein ACB092_02G130600 [Castanea dentata]
MVEVQLSNKIMASRNRIPSSKSFTRKCSSLVKEQRARIYVLRRCATMLLCWYIHGDD